MTSKSSIWILAVVTVLVLAPLQFLVARGELSNLWDRMVDAIRFSDAREMDKAIEAALIEQASLGLKSFAFADVFRSPVRRACVSHFHSVVRGNPTYELGLRSARPWWWKFDRDYSTIAAESIDGAVWLLRVRTPDPSGIGGLSPRDLRFVTPDAGNFACASGGALSFIRLADQAGITIQVRGERRSR